MGFAEPHGPHVEEDPRPPALVATVEAKKNGRMRCGVASGRSRPTRGANARIRPCLKEQACSLTYPGPLASRQAWSVRWTCQARARSTADPVRRLVLVH